ncbi:MAG: hypothetical protein ABJN72_03815 [Sulfitobacter sp.]
MIGYGKAQKEIRSATEDMREMWQAIHMAQEVGDRLGGSPVLFAAVQTGRIKWA